MRTLVHMSDLHFGRIDPALLEPALEKVHVLKPDLVVVSGDLTQRAKPEQFRQAKRFLDALPGPQVVVPGNHDVPLYNLFQRFFQPLDKFRRLISGDVEPSYVDGEIAVVGVNTARSLVFKGGRINEAQIERVGDLLCRLDERITKILVTHHPFDLPAGGDERHIVGRAAKAMKLLARCGADILLSGHLHTSDAAQTSARYRIEGFSALVVQAGTATSTRARGEVNSFNVLRIDANRVDIERMAWDEGARSFAVAAPERFERTAQGWLTAAPARAFPR
jgi:3',5'-cyclic AMP phosphodiesterase CpdA